MAIEWGEIPRHYAPRQVELIKQAQAYAEQKAEHEPGFESYELLAQAFIDGYAAGWDAVPLNGVSPRNRV